MLVIVPRDGLFFGGIFSSPLLNCRWVQCDLFSTLPHRTVTANLCLGLAALPHYISFICNLTGFRRGRVLPLGLLIICTHLSVIILPL